jgi:uncharacterized protein with PCYCGC motif
MHAVYTRRIFVGRLSGVLAALIPVVRSRPHHVCRVRVAGPHPLPRSGITAAKVLTREQLAETPAVVPVFDQVREIPEIIDGIRCQCGCAELEGYYSLLSCYEGDAMARSCPVCQGQGRLASRLHRDGKTLDEIRAAIDARYGG